MQWSAVAVLLCGASFVTSETKVWVPNVDYGNPQQWEEKRFPCPADRVVFPGEVRVAVKLPEGTTIVRELVLPSSGQLLLPETGELIVTGEPRRSTRECPGSDVKFSIRRPPYWLDPRNWRPLTGFNPAVPDVERLPCAQDTALITAMSTIRLPEVPVQVRGITIHKMILPHYHLRQAAIMDVDEEVLSGGAEGADNILYSEPCGNLTGCPCQDGGAWLTSVVCRYVGPSCRATTCSLPVQPQGFCCPICGAYLILDYNSQFNMAFLKMAVNSFVERNHGSDVFAHVGKLAESGKVQVVLAGRRDLPDTTAVDISVALADSLEEDAALGIVSVSLHTSGQATAAATFRAAAGTVFGTFFAVAVIFVVIFFIFVVRLDGMRFSLPTGDSAIPFLFARFENAPGADSASEAGESVEVEVALDVEQQQPQAFDNPMFGQRKEESGSREVTRENPVYSELKRREMETQENEGTTGKDTDETESGQEL